MEMIKLITLCPFHTNVTACVAGPSCAPFSTIAMRAHVAQAMADLRPICFGLSKLRMFIVRKAKETRDKVGIMTVSLIRCYVCICKMITANFQNYDILYTSAVFQPILLRLSKTDVAPVSDSSKIHYV